jgi:hypothetical protein
MSVVSQGLLSCKISLADSTPINLQRKHEDIRRTGLSKLGFHRSGGCGQGQTILMTSIESGASDLGVGRSWTLSATTMTA